MTVEILFKNRNINKIENVRKISNQSSNIENDAILIYCFNQADPRPRRIPLDDVLCWEVTEVTPSYNGSNYVSF